MKGKLIIVSALALAAVSSAAVGGCTTSAVKPEQKAAVPALAPEESVIVANFELDAASVVLDGSRYGELLGSIDKVIALARNKPDAVYATTDGEKRTMRQVLSDGAATLGRYQGDLSKKLELALETLPPPK